MKLEDLLVRNREGALAGMPSLRSYLAGHWPPELARLSLELSLTSPGGRATTLGLGPLAPPPPPVVPPAGQPPAPAPERPVLPTSRVASPLEQVGLRAQHFADTVLALTAKSIDEAGRKELLSALDKGFSAGLKSLTQKIQRGEKLSLPEILETVLQPMADEAFKAISHLVSSVPAHFLRGLVAAFLGLGRTRPTRETEELLLAMAYEQAYEALLEALGDQEGLFEALDIVWEQHLADLREELLRFAGLPEPVLEKELRAWAQRWVRQNLPVLERTLASL